MRWYRRPSAPQTHEPARKRALLTCDSPAPPLVRPQGLPHRRVLLWFVVDGLAAFVCATVERTHQGALQQLLCRSLWQRVLARGVSTAVLTTGAEYFASVFLSPSHGVVRRSVLSSYSAQKASMVAACDLSSNG